VTGIPRSGGIAAGGRHSISIAESCGHVFTWGDDASGQLGAGSVFPRVGGHRPEPRPVIGLGEDGLPTGCPVTLSVVMRSEGRVTIEGTPVQDMSCHAAPCAATFALDAVVNLTAVPEPGHEFIRWGGQCDSSDSAITIVMDRGRNCLAQFNALPIPVFSPEEDPLELRNIFGTRFDLSRAGDPDGVIVLYQWDFENDGTIDSASDIAAFRPTTPGDHPVRLIATDDQGGVGEFVSLVRVVDTPVAPVAAFFEFPESIRVGEQVSFAARNSRSVVRYQWDFDDDGSYDAEGQSVTHTYDRVGPTSVTLRVRDAAGSSDSTSRAVDVLPANSGQVTLRLIPRGGGDGTVLTSTESLVCNFIGTTSQPDPCVRTVPAGTTEVVRAFAANGSVFSHWEIGGCDSEPPGDPNPNCVVTLDADREIDVYFE
jgi:hypothetical protein